MVFTETLSEILWSALSSLQLEFHLHQVLGRELICVPKLRLCHHLMGAPQDVPACTGVKNDLKYDTTRFLRSRTCTPIPFLSPSNESLMLPFCLISETKWREDNDFLLSPFILRGLGLFLLVFFIFWKCWFVAALLSFTAHLQMPTKAAGAASERGRATRTCPLGLICGHCPHIPTKAEQLKTAWFQEMWPKLV